MWPRGPCSCWMRYPGKEASLRRNSSRRPTPAREFLDRFNHPLFFSLKCALTFSVACHSYYSFISKWPFQGFLGLSDRISRWRNKAKQPGSSHIPVVRPFVTILHMSNKIAVQVLYRMWPLEGSGSLLHTVCFLRRISWECCFNCVQECSHDQTN